MFCALTCFAVVGSFIRVVSEYASGSVDKAKWGSKFVTASCNNVMGPFGRAGPGASGVSVMGL